MTAPAENANSTAKVSFTGVGALTIDIPAMGGVSAATLPVEVSFKPN